MGQVSMYKGDTAPLGAPTGTLAAFSGSAGASLLSPCGLASPPVGAPAVLRSFRPPGGADGAEDDAACLPAGKEDDKARGAAWLAGNRRSPLYTDTRKIKCCLEPKRWNGVGDRQRDVLSCPMVSNN